MKKRSSLFLGITFTIAIISCKKVTTNDTQIVPENTVGTFGVAAPGTTLLFQSEFNPASSTVNAEVSQKSSMSGANDGYSWTTTTGGFNNAFRIEYESGTTNERKASITTNDSANGEGILKFSISDATTPINYGTYQFKQRVQADLFNYINPATGTCLKEFYQKVRLKLHGTSFQRILDSNIQVAKGSGNWLTLFENFNGVPSNFSDYSKAYRTGMNLEKTADKKFIVRISGEQYDTANHKWSETSPNNWEAKTTTFFIEPGKWYTYETYLKEGKGDSGLYWLKITNESTGEIAYLGSKTATRYTQSSDDPSNDGFDHIYPMKLYTSGDVIKVVNPKLTNPNATAIALQAYFGTWELYDKLQ